MKSHFYIYSLVTIIILLFSQCKSYVRVAPEAPEICFQSDKTAQLHFADQKIFFDNITLDETGLNGEFKVKLIKYKVKEGVQVSKEYTPRQEKLIHIYLNESFSSYMKSSGTAHIPYASIETIEIYETDKKKSVVYGIGTLGAYGLGGFGVTVGVAVILVALFKSSCPFIYTYDENNYNLTGEIFSGAVFPAIERHDYLKLPAHVIDGQYNMLVTNEVKEIQHINMLEMIVLEHNPQTKVLIDKYGKIHAVHNVTLPSAAVNQEGSDIREMLLSKDDDIFYSYKGESDNPSTVSRVHLNFNKPKDAISASLFIRAKNNSWLDYSYMRFHDQLGIYYDRWNKKQQKTNGKKMTKWSLDQKIPMKVLLEEGGELTYVDHFNVCGPIAFKEDVIGLDLSDVTGDELNLVLEFGFNFWEIDFVGIAYEYDNDINIYKIPPETILTLDGEDVKHEVLYDDDSYYVQYEVGEEAEVNFKLPSFDPERMQTYILHSKGYYDILMEVPEFRPRISDLRKLKRPLSFTEYSKQRYLELFQHQLVNMQLKKEVDGE